MRYIWYIRYIIYTYIYIRQLTVEDTSIWEFIYSKMVPLLNSTTISYMVDLKCARLFRSISSKASNSPNNTMSCFFEGPSGHIASVNGGFHPHYKNIWIYFHQPALPTARGRTKSHDPGPQLSCNRNQKRLEASHPKTSKNTSKPSFWERPLGSIFHSPCSFQVGHTSAGPPTFSLHWRS